ncbi:MAG: alkaline phosphatase D family protein [Pirellulaceae bacterium]
MRTMLRRWILGMGLLMPSAVAVGQEADPKVLPVPSSTSLPTRIAFGSCGHQNKPQPVLDRVVQAKPDLFIYLGDNIYGDTRDMKLLQAKYDLLGAKPEFQRLRASVPVVSIWDDHDYGENDAGIDYPMKEESRAIFFDFWRVPADSPRRSHPGIYGVHFFEQDGKRLQLILLDTRTFRTPLIRRPKNDPNPQFKNDYIPDPNPEKTFLGDRQWQWLEEQLREPADLRLIASSIQFSHEYNGYESWTNYPAQQEMMFDLIRKTKASGVCFVSGDVHWAELSKRSPEGIYPIYDLTASGITETWFKVEPNQYRIGEAVRQNHFGMMEIDWQANPISITWKVIDVEGKEVLKHSVSLDQLQLPTPN